MDEIRRMRKRKGPTQNKSSAKRQRTTTDDIMLEVQTIMESVRERLSKKVSASITDFVVRKIQGLETDKRELVGVFGKTGAGKSSLINAIIGEKDLLPTGGINACTMVMIKVEANMDNSKYEAEIEFIAKEEWKNECSSCDDDDRDIVKKLTALYGEDYKKSPEQFLQRKYFSEVLEFLQSKKKTLTCGSAEELSKQLVKYTRSEPNEGEGKVKMYWPLVKCVTVRVPENEFLQHVTLVDLPGNGDYNKSRDQMWKEIVRDCSTVWIVTDIDRAASADEPWEILESTCSLIGNGGECQQIHFICTKSDQTGVWDDDSRDKVRRHILEKNENAKKKVKSEFEMQNKIKQHFSDDCFKVFTVSSKEFLKQKNLQEDETEIPKLQKFLRDLNDRQSETLNYVSRAHGILCWIQGARQPEATESKTKVSADIEEKMNQLGNIRETTEKVYKTFEKLLSKGVENSKSSCEGELEDFFDSQNGSAFHKTLKCVATNGGASKPKTVKQINLNAMLSSHLTDSIDKKFKQIFPNNRQCEPFNGIIGEISFVTDELIQKYNHVALLLDFLKTEEENMKTNLISKIRNDKKAIYSSLTDSIETTMKDCYEEAANSKGKGALKKMKHTIKRGVQQSKDVMFDKAKDDMLKKLKKLTEDILETLGTTMMEAVKDSFETDDSIPDVSKELGEVKKIYNDLKAHKK